MEVYSMLLNRKREQAQYTIAEEIASSAIHGAGLIFSMTGRIAKRGEIIRHESGLAFEIVEADPRRLKSVRIHKPTDAEDDLIK